MKINEQLKPDTLRPLIIKRIKELQEAEQFCNSKLDSSSRTYYKKVNQVIKKQVQSLQRTLLETSQESINEVFSNLEPDLRHKTKALSLVNVKYTTLWLSNHPSFEIVYHMEIEELLKLNRIPYARSYNCDYRVCYLDCLNARTHTSYIWLHVADAKDLQFMEYIQNSNYQELIITSGSILRKTIVEIIHDKLE